MKWFGDSWQRGCEDELHERVPVPVGATCLWCDEKIEPHHRGYLMPYFGCGRAAEVPEHLECFIRSIVGSIGHQMRVCSCYGGNAGDMENHTKRQAAIASYTLWTNHMTGGRYDG